MIAESLKRKVPVSGLPCQPPPKVRLLCNGSLWSQVEGNWGPNLYFGFSETGLVARHLRKGQFDASCFRRKRQLEKSQETPASDSDNIVSCKRLCLSTHRMRGTAATLGTTTEAGLPVPSAGLNKKSDDSEENLNSNYSNFTFWRPVLPDITAELAQFVQQMDIDEIPQPSAKKEPHKSPEKEEENAEFNSFNFWRLPVLDIDLDL